MSRLTIVLDPGVHVTPGELAECWNGDEVASAAGPATVSAARAEAFFGVLDLVVVPLAVNLATSAITAMVVSLIAKIRRRPDGHRDLEIAQMTRANGDRVVVVRLREVPR